MLYIFSLQALKREKDLCELARKVEAESSGVPENTHASEMTEKDQTPDIFLQPLRCVHTDLNMLSNPHH